MTLKYVVFLKELWIRLQGHGHRGWTGQIVSLKGHQNKAEDGEKKKRLIIMIGLSEAGRRGQ